MNGSDNAMRGIEVTWSEELVAYLDGELELDRRRYVEEQLSTNPELRQMLKELQQSWDMLDELPRGQVDETFARSTVEMVAIRAEAEVDEQSLRAARRRLIGWSVGLAMILIAAAIGFGVSYYNLSRTNRQVVRDLPILENLDAYQSAGSIDFLRALEKEGLFRDEETDAP